MGVRGEVDAPLARRAAVLLAALLAVVGGFHIYWAAGGTWGMSEALGGEVDDPSVELQLASAAVALFLLVAALVGLGRVGLWGERVPFSLFRWGTWALAVALALAAVNNLAGDSAWERFAFAPLALLLALLAAVVALSPAPRGRV